MLANMKVRRPTTQGALRERHRRVQPATAKTTWIAVIALAVLIGAPSLRGGQVGQLQVDSYAFPISHHEVSDVFFLNDSTGWITITDHDKASFYIFSTVDGGQKWTEWKVPDGTFRISFVSKSLGWALRQAGSSDRGRERVYLLRTDDGGRTWRQISRIPIASLADESAYSGARFSFIDASHGWFVGSSAVSPVLETSDGGVSTRAVRNASTTALTNTLTTSTPAGVKACGCTAQVSCGIR